MIFWTLPRNFREFSRFFEIFGDFWIVLGDFQGVSESFVEFQRFLEIFGDFWRCSESFRRLPLIKSFVRMCCIFIFLLLAVFIYIKYF